MTDIELNWCHYRKRNAIIWITKKQKILFIFVQQKVVLYTDFIEVGLVWQEQLLVSG